MRYNGDVAIMWHAKLKYTVLVSPCSRVAALVRNR